MSVLISELMKSVSPAFIKKAEKVQLREVEEEKPLHYVAFADEKKDSFDISISLDGKESILDFACECDAPKTSFCVHLMALLLHLQIF